MGVPLVSGVWSAHSGEWACGVHVPTHILSQHCPSPITQKQEEESERHQREKLEREAERERLQREAKEREEQRKNAELKELKRRKAEDRLEKLKKTAVGARALADIKPEVAC